MRVAENKKREKASECESNAEALKYASDNASYVEEKRFIVWNAVSNSVEEECDT